MNDEVIKHINIRCSTANGLRRIRMSRVVYTYPICLALLFIDL